MTRSITPNWLTQLILDAEHQGEFEVVALLSALTMLIGAYLLAVAVLVWDVL